MAEPALKADFLRMEESWLNLARSYAFTDRLGDFTAARRPPPRPQAKADPAPDEALQLQEISALLIREDDVHALDRKSTRLNSSHVRISYAVFCLKKTTS